MVNLIKGDMKSHLCISVLFMFSVISLFSQIPGWASLPAMMAGVELKQDNQSDQVILSNEIVSIAFNMSNGMYTISDIASGDLRKQL